LLAQPHARVGQTEVFEVHPVGVGFTRIRQQRILQRLDVVLRQVGAEAVRIDQVGVDALDDGPKIVERRGLPAYGRAHRPRVAALVQAGIPDVRVARPQLEQQAALGDRIGRGVDRHLLSGGLRSKERGHGQADRTERPAARSRPERSEGTE